MESLVRHVRTEGQERAGTGAFDRTGAGEGPGAEQHRGPGPGIPASAAEHAASERHAERGAVGLGKESGHMVAAPIRALEVRLVEWDGDSFQPCEVEADGTLIVAIGYDTETLGTVSGEIAALSSGHTPTSATRGTRTGTRTVTTRPRREGRNETLLLDRRPDRPGYPGHRGAILSSMEAT